MVLLPDNIVIDPRYETFCFDQNNHEVAPWQNHEGTRLWARHFASLGRDSGVDIPPSWRDFFTIALLNPVRFDWARSLLGSKAWELIIKDKEFEATVTFSILTKCLVNKEITCDQDESNHAPDCKQNDTMHFIEPIPSTPEGPQELGNKSVSTSILHIIRR
jgi:hypothetical protein